MNEVSIGTTAERAAKNESTFRDANERLEAAERRMAYLEAVPFLCECPRRSCTALTLISFAEYELVRQTGARFLVLPGHEATDIDGVEIARIVERRDSYTIMDKIGEAGEIAKALDPRGGNSNG